MLSALIVSTRRQELADFESALKRHGLSVSWLASGRKALDKVSNQVFDLVVTDEKLPDMNGFEFARNLIAVNLMVNCAAVSRLSSEAFHETTEGLGLLMQLPLEPDEKDAKRLIRNLKRILN